MSTDSKYRSRPSCATTAADHALLIAQKFLVLTAAVVAVAILAKIVEFSWNYQASILEELATFSPI